MYRDSLVPTAFRKPALALRFMLMIAVLLALFAPGAVARPSRTTFRASSQPSTLLARERQGRRLVPLNGTTLADATDSPVLTSGSSYVSWVASADGSRLVSIEDSEHGVTTVIVRDAGTGRERSRFRPPVSPAYWPIISPDGTKLIMMTRDLRLEWIVLDTATGRLLTTISTNDYKPFGSSSFFPALRFWIDPDGLYLHGLVCACSTEGAGPESAQLVRYELSTGKEAGRLDLPQVLAGIWRVDDGKAGEPVLAHLTPGLAVSPDGARLAVVHAGGDAVTPVDLQRFAVGRTVAITRPSGVLDRLLGLLPLLPHEASAKWVPEGTLRAAAFHPDGRRLYVYGFENWMKPSGGEDRRGLGLQLIDLESGEILAETGDDAYYNVVLPAPEGQSVYVDYVPDMTEGEGTLLRRLDATSLEPVAERQFSGWYEVMLLPIELGGE